MIRRSKDMVGLLFHEFITLHNHNFIQRLKAVMRSSLRNKRGNFFFPHWDLNWSPLELTASWATLTSRKGWLWLLKINISPHCAFIPPPLLFAHIKSYYFTLPPNEFYNSRRVKLCLDQCQHKFSCLSFLNQNFIFD